MLLIYWTLWRFFITSFVQFIEHTFNYAQLMSVEHWKMFFGLHSLCFSGTQEQTQAHSFWHIFGFWLVYCIFLLWLARVVTSILVTYSRYVNRSHMHVSGIVFDTTLCIMNLLIMIYVSDCRSGSRRGFTGGNQTNRHVSRLQTGVLSQQRLHSVWRTVRHHLSEHYT